MRGHLGTEPSVWSTSMRAERVTHESVHGPGVFYDLGWSDGCIFELGPLVHVVDLVHQQEQPGLGHFIHP